MQKNNTTKIEAQGGEIITRNTYGDVAIIPKNLVKKYQAYMKAGCDECIDELVASLPAMSQYAADGTVIPQGKKVKVTLPDGEQAEYSTDSVEYKNLYSSGKLANVVKDKVTGEDTYVMPSLKEVEIVGKATGAARDMIDTKKSYSKEQYIKEKLPAFAGSLGVTADNLGGNAEGYKRTINTKVAENIFKRKPNAKEKDLTPYELGVINNSDLAYKLKPDILDRFEQGWLSVGNAGSPVEFKNPNLTQDQARVEDTPLNILAPIEYGSKAVQALYKPGYTLKDAAKGKANNAGVVEDMVTDPLNLLGLGLIDDLPKLGKAAKALSKERQIAESVENMTKLETLSQDAPKWLSDLLSDTSLKNRTIAKEGNAYFNALDNPESLKRLKDFSNEYDVDLVSAYKRAKIRWEKGMTIEGHSRFKIAGDEVFKDNITDAIGVSTYDNDFILKEYLSKNKSRNRNLSEGSVNYINQKADIRDFHRVVWHELSHDINKDIIGNDKFTAAVAKIFETDITKIDRAAAEKARQMSKKLYKSNWKEITAKVNQSLDERIAEETAYISNPTETWAFLSTNLRQDLKSAGIIKDYNEILTLEKLDQAVKNGTTIYSRFEPYIKDKAEFIKLFNKMTLGIGTAAVTTPALKDQLNKNKSIRMV